MRLHVTLLAAGLVLAAPEPSIPDYWGARVDPVQPQFGQSTPPAAAYPNDYYPGYADPSAAAGAQSGQTSPPKYPSPWQDGSGNWASAVAKAKTFVKGLTTIEKVNLTTGSGWQEEFCVGQTGSIPRVGFRSMCHQDSPLGVRLNELNSVFPGGATVAATWDRSLFYLRGADMGAEHRAKGVDVQLGPVVGPIGRAPAAGRNWEGFSPDPVLSGIAVAETVQGIQSQGVIACTKHFIGNEQETFRQSGSSNIDDVTMHELYLWPFADAVRAGTGAVMCSYNRVNNSYACQNSYTMNYLLKNELGFQGFITSDYSAQHSGVASALAGLDQSMPGDVTFGSAQSYFATNLTVAVLNGSVPLYRLNDMATRIVAAWYYVDGQTNQQPISFSSWYPTFPTYGLAHYGSHTGPNVTINLHVNVQGNHGTDIRNIAARGTVLLKNTANALPLNPARQSLVGIFGEDAAPPVGGNPLGYNACSDRGCDNGTLGIGWGSGTANYPYFVDPLSAITSFISSSGGGPVQSATNDYNTTQITSLAQQASTCLVFVNSDSGEGYITVDGNAGDRNNLTLWQNGDQVVSLVAASCPNTIVVMHGPGPILIGAWYNSPNVTGILYAGMPGQESGNSIVDVLFGAVNPSAKLPFTLGFNRTDYGTDVLYKNNNNGGVPQLDFAEGKFIDYRAFDKFNTTPIYEFGFGLSYTTFSFSNLKVVKNPKIKPYVPNSGMTTAPPSFGTRGTAAEFQYPSNLTRIHPYMYPYLSSTNLQTASGDSHYGIKGTLPPNAASAKKQPKVPAGGAPGGNPGLYDVLFTVSCTVTNTGTVDGEEVPQMYISLGGADDPKVVLRNFDKLAIAAGQSATFTTQIVRRDLSNWNTKTQNWVITSAKKTVYVGNSSRHLPLSRVLPTVK